MGTFGVPPSQDLENSQWVVPVRETINVFVLYFKDNNLKSQTDNIVPCNKLLMSLSTTFIPQRGLFF